MTIARFSDFTAVKADGKLIRPDGTTVDRAFPSREGTFFARITGGAVDCYASGLTGPNGTAVAFEWDAPGALPLTSKIGESALYNGGRDALVKYPSAEGQRVRTISVSVMDSDRAKKTYTRTFLPTPFEHVNKSENRIHYTGKGNETVTHTVNFTPAFTGKVVVEWQQVGGPVVAGVAPRTVDVVSGTRVTDTLTFTAPAVTARTTWTWVPVVLMGDPRYPVVGESQSYTAVPQVATVASQDLSVMDSKRPAWVTTPVASAPLASNTDFTGAPTQAQIQTYIQSELSTNGVVVNTDAYTASTFMVDASTPRYRVEFFDKWGWRYIPGEWYTAGGRQIALNVPIPDEAIWAAGTDGHMMMVDSAADKVYETWLTWCDRQNRWQAANLGRCDNYTTSLGRFTGTEGVTAAGLSWLPIMLTIKECELAVADLKARGRAAWLADPNAVRVKHAVYMAMLNPRAGATSWPAVRTDGNNANTAAPREGQRLRLDPALNLATLTGLNDFGLVLARAFQEYSVVVADKAGSVNVGCQSGLPTARRTGVDPWTPLLEGAANWQILQAIPKTAWQAIKVDWLKPT